MYNEPATKKQLSRMQWGFKFVGADLCTDDHRGGRFRYRLGEWVEAPLPDGEEFTVGECPAFPGDGLCVARTITAATSGGARLGSSVMLIVGFLPENLISHGTHKIRVSRMWVHPDPLDPVRMLVSPGADLRGADLRGIVLSGADLRGADLSGADIRRAILRRAVLSGADLRGADLRRSDLSGAVLRRAVLSGADLRGADLNGADIRRAVLRGTDLRDADLNGADLRRADLRSILLSGADLRGADIRRAILRRAVLSGADLSGAVGDKWTLLPAGWKVSDSGLVVPS